MPLDPRHGRNLPAGAALARTLRRVFERQAHDALAAIRLNQPLNLSRWNQTLAELAKPQITHYTAAGGHDCMARIKRQVRQRLGRKSLYSSSPAIFPLRVGDFDLFNPRVLDAIQNAVLVFAASTNATSQMSVDEAREQLRRDLAEGLEQGEAGAKLAKRVRAIFQDGPRATMIARTEASRAVHTGQVLAAKESGIVKAKVWLTSSRPCPRCEELNGKSVGLDDAFSIDPKGGPYRVIVAPPLHPH